LISLLTATIVMVHDYLNTTSLSSVRWFIAHNFIQSEDRTTPHTLTSSMVACELKVFFPFPCAPITVLAPTFA
jgi:hypothetical protein